MSRRAQAVFSGLRAQRRTPDIVRRVGLGAIVALATAMSFALLDPHIAWCQESADAGTALNYNLIDLIKFGGWVGYIIIFLSVVAVALVVEYAMSIRLGALAPSAEVEELTELINRGACEDIASKLRDGNCSFLAAVWGWSTRSTKFPFR
jgi:hypothetical protein